MLYRNLVRSAESAVIWKKLMSEVTGEANVVQNYSGQSNLGVTAKDCTRTNNRVISR